MVHTQEKMCTTAEVFVVFENRVLLRMHDKYKFWCSVGGHIEPGEDPNEAALREVKEEVGLDVELWGEPKRFHIDEETFRNLIPPVGLNRHSTGDGHEHTTFVYFAKATSGAVVPEQGSDEWKWLSREELDTLDLKKNIREYALGALDALSV